MHTLVYGRAEAGLFREPHTRETIAVMQNPVRRGKAQAVSPAWACPCRRRHLAFKGRGSALGYQCAWTADCQHPIPTVPPPLAAASWRRAREQGHRLNEEGSLSSRKAEISSAVNLTARASIHGRSAPHQGAHTKSTRYRPSRPATQFRR